MRRWTAAATGAAAIAAVAVHAPLWPTAFYFDDHPHLLLAQAMPLAQAVSGGLFGTYYRPLGQAAWWLLARPGVADPVIGHLVVAAAIAATLWLVASTLRRLGASPGVAAGAAVAGALLPTTVVTAAWVSNLYGALSALAGWAAVRCAVAERRAVASWLAAALVMASLAAKEDGVAFAAAVVAVVVGRLHGRRRWATALAAVAAVAVWAVVRTRVLDGAGTLLAAGSLPRADLVVGIVVVAAALLAGALRAPDPKLRIGFGVASVAVPAGGLLWALAPADLQTPDLRLRFGYLVGLAVLPLGAAAAERIRAAGTVPRIAATVVLGGIAAAMVVVDLHAVAGWRARTAAADALVERVADAAMAQPDRRLALVLSPVAEIGLDPAVRRRLGAAAPVVVRPAREAFLVVPEDLWPAVRGRFVTTALPGNPARAAGFVVAHGVAVPPAWTDPDPELGPAIVVR